MGQFDRVLAFFGRLFGVLVTVKRHPLTTFAVSIESFGLILTPEQLIPGGQPGITHFGWHPFSKSTSALFIISCKGPGILKIIISENFE